jgi:hypothetical protein
MHADPTSLCPTPTAPDNDVGRAVRDRQQPPEEGGTAVAHRCTPVVENGSPASRSSSHGDRGPMRGSPSHGQNGCGPAPLRRQRRVAHGVDAPMDSVQAPGEHTRSHRVVAYPGTARLRR